jgi:hypothetical protein
MRLLDTNTLELVEFFHLQKKPEYVILSHTWGQEEVTLDEMRDHSHRSKKQGFAKILHVCKQAVKDGFQYAWVDT